MRREERVTVQGPVKEQQPDGMSHGGGGGAFGGRALLVDSTYKNTGDSNDERGGAIAGLQEPKRRDRHKNEVMEIESGPRPQRVCFLGPPSTGRVLRANLAQLLWSCDPGLVPPPASQDESAAKRRRGPQPAGRGGQNPPNNVLFVEQLPENNDDTQQMLTVLFQNFQGFREVRMPPSNAGVAFAEFDVEPNATNALTNLQGFRITPENELKVSYAKR